MAIFGSARALAAIIAASSAVAAVSACSSSSSGGAGATPSVPASAAIAAEHSPSMLAETFKHVTAKQADNLENVLPLERGVQSDVYYPDTKKFVVTFKADATKLDQQNVENLVRQAKTGKKLKPQQPRSSSTPTPTASVAALPTPTLKHHPVHRSRHVSNPPSS